MDKNQEIKRLMAIIEHQRKQILNLRTEVFVLSRIERL